MHRRSRMYLPGFTYHIVQRGNNRQTCFFEDGNYLLYLQLMREVIPRYGADLHAYCLMTNHVHLLISPERDDSISNIMKVVCSRYAQYVNRKYSRTGSLWEGRHKASAVDTENYLLKCYRYIECNPVAARMVERPEEYLWSSYRVNALGDDDDLVSPHKVYSLLGKTPESRRCQYRELFSSSLSEQDSISFRRATHYSMPIGSDCFIETVSAEVGRHLGYMSRGRPEGKAG